jgi:hypothetical protein
LNSGTLIIILEIFGGGRMFLRHIRNINVILLIQRMGSLNVEIRMPLIGQAMKNLFNL